MDTSDSDLASLRNLADSVSMSTLASLMDNSELQVELIGHIYPGAEIITKLGEIHIVTHVHYRANSDEVFPEIDIRLQSSEELHTLYFNARGEVEMKSLSSRFRPIVYFASPRCSWIEMAWKIFDRNVFYIFMDFDYEQDWNFSKFIKHRWDEFAIFASREKREFLMEQLDAAFVKEPKHSPKCSDKTHYFDGEHLCEPSGHLLILLDLAMDTRNFLVPTKKACLGGVSIINGIPQYIHITPGGSFVTGISGQGTCRHPLTRILFWSVLLKFRPEFEQLYLRQYKSILLDDLFRYRFGAGDTLRDLVNNFNTNLSLVTGTASVHVNLYPVRSWGDHPIVHTKMYEFEYHYRLHLLILALLRNGWTGKTKIYYCGNKITFTLETCQQLLKLPTRKATQAYIKNIAPIVKYDTDTSD